MFTLGIRYLMGRAVAARYEMRDEPEWPPHPDRVFMALVAAQAEGEESADEAEALRWLEQLSAPAISASRVVSHRDPVTVFVPVNDTADPVVKGRPLAPMGALPIGRVRQPRHFPATVPESPDVFLTWEHDLPTERCAALERLCRKVTYLGHSSSPVQLWIQDDPPAPVWTPDDDGPVRLRVAGKGRFEELRRLFQLGIRPTPSRWQGYRLVEEEPQAEALLSPFSDELIVLRQVSGPRYGLEAAHRLGKALRNTLMSRAGLTPSPSWLSGHEESGQPHLGEHLAIFPLGFVGREHADGHLMGLALALPRTLGPDEVTWVYRWLEAEPGYSFVCLTLGQRGVCRLELDTRPERERAFTLRPSTYTGGRAGASLWGTVTPIVFDQFPRRRLTPGDVVINSCLRTGLPMPVQVKTGLASPHEGAPHSRAFPALPASASRPPHPMTHALIDFGRPVRGPILVGAGRYLGYGLLRPVEQRGNA